MSNGYVQSFSDRVAELSDANNFYRLWVGCLALGTSSANHLITMDQACATTLLTQ